jgi:hypothetical protein
LKRTTLAVFFACLLGIPAGIGAFTFVYAKGFSYLSCHLPHAGIAKWVVKADHGVRHSAEPGRVSLRRQGRGAQGVRARLRHAVPRRA